ncbi:pectate lyase-like adhesive domain-containing protein, partial [Staphylococcus aureus]|uniref:pectate lyase-like adhesive domain-containing protein n=1 Tax=Staphylococcus aureus TaxID=1280 RepID=UPI000AC7E0AE
MEKRRQGPINKKVDFLSNKLNKYSIRKFTVGTASILVGATLIFGHSNDEAKAAEVNKVESSAQLDQENVAKTNFENESQTASNQDKTSEVTQNDDISNQDKTSEVTQNDDTSNQDKTSEVTQNDDTSNSTDTKKASSELTQDVSSTLKNSSNAEESLTNYLKNEANLSDEVANQVVNNMNVDLNNASESEISNSLLASYLQNSSSPGNDPLDTSVIPRTMLMATPRSNVTSFRSAPTAQAPATQVSNWDEYVSAMNDKSVSNIQLTKDITANKVGTLNVDNGRKVAVDGDGHTLDTSNYYINAPANSGNWDITLSNTNLKTNNSEGFINFAPSTSTNNTLTLKDITHTGSNIVNDTNVNNNLTVKLEGKVNSTSNDSNLGRATIGAKNIEISDAAKVDFTRNGLGSAFQVSDNGTITTGKDSIIDIDVSTSKPWGTTNGNTAFKAGKNSNIQLGDNSKTNIKGQNIFDFGDGGTLNTGLNSTVNVNQKGNGNIVNMGKNSTFEVNKDSKFIAYSDGHRVGDWQSNNLIGLDGNSKILVDENATLLLDAKNHQWDPDRKVQVGNYNDLVNINATGNETALLHVADNATLDLRTDNRNYYAEVVSIPLGGSNQDRRYVFDNAYYVNLQKTSKVTSGQSPNGQKPNLIFMEPGSPGYFQWNGSYIAKTWDPMHYSSPEQHADADNIWENVVDLKAEQNGFTTGVPTYNKDKSTLTSTTGTPLSKLNLNYAQRLVLISNNSDNPEAKPEKTTEDIPFETKREFDPDLAPGTEEVVQKGEPGTKTITRQNDGSEPTEEITKDPVDEIIHYGGEEI